VAVELNRRSEALSPLRGPLECHSDKSEFCSDLNEQKGCELSESALSVQGKFEDFQAEYEGSIPFTRSSSFKDFARGSDSFRQMGCFAGCDDRIPIDCFACRLIRCRIPRTAPDRLRGELIKTEYLCLEKRY
jgi:hypothetical protein